MDIPVLITSPENLFYYTGFQGSDACVILWENRPVIVTDFRYEESAKALGFPVVLTKMGQPLDQATKDYFKELGCQTVLFESEHLTVERFQIYQEALTMLPLEKSFLSNRSVKDEGEVALMRKAAEISSNAFQQVMEHISPGMTEKEVAAELEYRMKRFGAEEASFPTIVAFGKNASMPHHVPDDTRLAAKDCVLIDMGARFHGYCSDMTRTFCIGGADQDFEKIYEIVNSAQQMALDALKPGISCQALDNLARDYIRKAGYGDCFGHGLGHGVGIAIHEYPTVNAASTQKIQAGMMVTVEPGIYLPGAFGVRIEDLCHVTEDGYENLTLLDKTLHIK